MRHWHRRLTTLMRHSTSCAPRSLYRQDPVQAASPEIVEPTIADVVAQDRLVVVDIGQIGGCAQERVHRLLQRFFAGLSSSIAARLLSFRLSPSQEAPRSYSYPRLPLPAGA